jgi:hypothetical protein
MTQAPFPSAGSRKQIPFRHRIAALPFIRPVVSQGGPGAKIRRGGRAATSHSSWQGLHSSAPFNDAPTMHEIGPPGSHLPELCDWRISRTKGEGRIIKRCAKMNAASSIVGVWKIPSSIVEGADEFMHVGEDGRIVNTNPVIDARSRW